MAAKQFLTNLRPAMLVRLQMRLEDYSSARKESDNTTSEDTPNAVRIRDLTSQENKLSNKLFGPMTAGLESGRVSSAEYNKVEGQLGAVRAELSKLKEAAPSARGVAEQAKNDPYSVTILTCPMSMDVELNTYRSLDTLSVILPFMDAPLEAQIMRSCMIEAFIGTVAEEDFATPGRWRLPTDKSTIVFRGYVDDWATKHDDTDSTVTISARSLECLLIDAKVDATSPLFKVQKSEKISAFVNRVIASVPATSSRNGDQLKAHFFRAEGEPYLDQAMLNRVLQTAKSRAAAANTDKNKAAIITDPNLGGTDPGAVQGTGDPRLPGKIAQEMTAWDLIIQACDLVGCVPSYDPSITVFDDNNLPLQGDYIMIRPPQTIYERVDQGTQVVGGAEDKFSRLIPNQNSSNSPSQVRFMVWGNNIKSFTASRKLGRVTVPAVEIIGYNPDSAPDQKPIIVRYPPKDKESKRATKVGPKGDGQTEQVYRKRINGVRSKEQLLQYAVSLYHAIGRNELNVTIETHDMMSYYDKENPDITPDNYNDLLKVRYGTPCRVLVGRTAPASAGQVTGSTISVTPLSAVFERGADELRAFLLSQRQRFDPAMDERAQVALVNEQVDRITAVLKSSKRTDLFFCKTVKHHFSADEGWTGTMELINYVEIRNDPANMSTTAQTQNAKHQLKTVPTKTTASVAKTRARQSQGGQ